MHSSCMVRQSDHGGDPLRPGRVPSNDGLGGVDFQEDMGCKYARYTRSQVLRRAPPTQCGLLANREDGGCSSCCSLLFPAAPCSTIMLDD